MEDDYTKFEFSRIDTEGHVRGKLITSSHVFRTRPATYAEYQAIDKANVRAYGNDARTIGWRA